MISPCLDTTAAVISTSFQVPDVLLVKLVTVVENAGLLLYVSTVSLQELSSTFLMTWVEDEELVILIRSLAESMDFPAKGPRSNLR